jgi:hypothetical protein
LGSVDSNTAALITATAQINLNLDVTTLYVDARGGRANPVIARNVSIPVTDDTPAGEAIAALERAVLVRAKIASARGLASLAGTRADCPVATSTEIGQRACPVSGKVADLNISGGWDGGPPEG